MNIEIRMKMTMDEVKAVERLIKTFDAFELMPPYLITVEWKPTPAYISDTSNIKVDLPHETFGVVIRIINKSIYRIQIVEKEVG